MIVIDTRKILEIVKRGIISRTQSGKDVNNVAFKPYKDKKKKSSKVDLTLTGHMLNSLNVNDNSLGFDNSFAIDKAIGNQSNGRVFMGISPDQEIEILKLLDRQLDAQLQKELNTWNTR